MSTSASSPALPARPPLLTIALLSACALAYEILLMRLFSIIQWHHFAWMIISLALLGYGASGAFLALTQSRLLNNYAAALLVNLGLFAGSALPAFLLAQQVPFNPEQMLWDWHQVPRLTAIYLLLSLPFLFAANAIALTLARYRAIITRVYAVDLLGAGIGSLGVIVLLTLLPPLPALTALSLAALSCLPLAAMELRLPRRGRILAASLPLMAAALWLGNSSELHPSPYKDISQTLRVSGAKLVGQRDSPLARIQVVDNTRIPLRHAPGLSLNAGQGPPAQLGLFADGNHIGAITHDSGNADALGFLDHLTSALPYHLNPPKRVLVVAAGGGMEVLQAHHLGAGSIDALELNPQIIALLDHDFAAYSGHLYQRPELRLHAADGRGFIGSHQQRYDLIQLSLQTGGLHALSENYLFTVEALELYLAHLQAGGYLAITQQTRLPPRDSLKLFATAIEALRRGSVSDAGSRLIMIRGWRTSTLLVAGHAIGASEITALRRFCKARGFDPVWYPGMSAAEANHYNILQRPWFHDAAVALLGAGAADFIADYKFDLRPATDDRPYFGNFFKWSTLPEILALREQGGLPLLQAGYPVLVATLIQALIASALLILLPLLFLLRDGRRGERDGQAHPVSHLRVVLYFTAIGLAFLFVEIAFIQKFMRFLHHPLYTTAVVLASFLVFAGLGSQQAERLTAHTSLRHGVVLAVAGILLSGLAGLLWLDGLFTGLADWPLTARIALSIVLIAPLAFFMGIPFPLALTSLGRAGGRLIPLAWAVNGCASVISAVLAMLLAIHFGFSVVIILALLLYGMAVIAFPGHR